MALKIDSAAKKGNTYSLLETERLIAFGEAAPGRTPFETQMVLNHKAAIEFLVDAVDEIGFDRRTILNLHALLSDNLLGNPSASGRLRAIPVSIGKSVYEPLAVPQLIHEIFGQILNTAVAISDPFEHFLKITKEEIAALHEGNFARYRLRPPEFNDWQKRKR